VGKGEKGGEGTKKGGRRGKKGSGKGILGEITQPLGLLRRSRSFKVTEFGTYRKLIYDFLLVNPSLV